MSGARPPRARLVPGGCPSPPGECSAARTAGTAATATWSRRPTSPPEAAGPSPLPAEQGSRTAARAGTCQAPGCRDVTPGAGTHHAQRPGVPWPAPARLAHHQVDGESLAQPARNTQERHPRRTYEQVHLACGDDDHAGLARPANVVNRRTQFVELVDGSDVEMAGGVACQSPGGVDVPGATLL